MKFNPIVIKYLSDRCGCDVTTDKNAETILHLATNPLQLVIRIYLS